MLPLFIAAVVFLGGAMVLRAWVNRGPLVEQQEDTSSGPFVIPTRRANGPALRVYLCVVCLKVHVRAEGDACSACLRDLDPVARAVEITREAAS